MAPTPTNGVELGANFESAADKVASQIQRHGPLPFDDVVEIALYDPEHGFYSQGGAAGRRRGDFITSPEVGPLFATVLARAYDQWWHELGEPDPFIVVDCGAGTGTLANGIRLAEAECRAALTYVLVEQSPALRAHHGDHLELSAPELALGPQHGSDDHDETARAERGTGPRFVSLDSMPALSMVGVVTANELLDNLPFAVVERAVVERATDEWLEVRVALSADQQDLVEQLVPAPERLAREAEALVPAAAIGARFPIQTRATTWLRDALAQVDRGRVVVIDYASTTPALAARPSNEWLRTYREHERGGAPLDRLGSQDITVDVCVDQLARVRSPDREQTQSEFLRAHGLGELVEEGRRTWNERAHVGDLQAVRGRSRINEAEALTDPDGLGSFRVLEWQVGPV